MNDYNNLQKRGAILSMAKKEQSLKGLYAGGAVAVGAFAVGVALLTNTVVSNMSANMLDVSNSTAMNINQAGYADTVDPQYSTTYVDPTTGLSNSNDSQSTQGNYGNNCQNGCAANCNPVVNEDTTENDTTNEESSTAINEPEDENTITECDHEHMEVDSTGDGIYYIKKGDTLSYVSSLTGYSVDELAEYNEIRDINIINEGSVLRVPLEATCKCTVTDSKDE